MLDGKNQRITWCRRASCSMIIQNKKCHDFDSLPSLSVGKVYQFIRGLGRVCFGFLIVFLPNLLGCGLIDFWGWSVHLLSAFCDWLLCLRMDGHQRQNYFFAFDFLSVGAVWVDRVVVGFWKPLWFGLCIFRLLNSLSWSLIFFFLILIFGLTWVF